MRVRPWELGVVGGGAFGGGFCGGICNFIASDACVCVILYFYTATCGPKGHGSGGFFQKDLFLSPIEMINPSGAPLSPSSHDPPDKRKREINKTKERKKKKEREKVAYPLIPQQEEPKLHSRRTRPAFFPCVAPASLLAQILLSLLRKLPSGADAPYPGALQEHQNRLRGLLLPKPLARGGPRILPPMRLPDFLPQFPDLGQPGPALREEVVAGLPLSSSTPPTFIICRPADLVLQVGADGGVSGQQLVVAPCH